jgi:hypothetical protein
LCEEEIILFKDILNNKYSYDQISIIGEKIISEIDKEYANTSYLQEDINKSVVYEIMNQIRK